VAFPYSLDTGLDEFVFDGDPPSELPGGHGIFTGDLHYIRAERNGPQTSSPTSNAEVRVHRRLGRDGEYAAQYLSEFGEEEIQNRALLHPGALSAQLRHQVEAWLGEISPGTRIYAQSHSALDRVSLHYAFATGRGETNHYRATNVGFGLSYLLPVLIVALAAPPGALLLLENPEAHIHPRGQMSIGRLLALASLGSVQIIVETHSDHILNGLRLAVHGGQVTPEDVALHYFQRQVEAHSNHSIVTSPGIDRDGRLDQWPDGFFDQNEKAMRELLMPGRKK
jgi:predicted ATPase